MRSDFLKIFNFLYYSNISFDLSNIFIGKMGVARIHIKKWDTQTIYITFDYIYERIIIKINSNEPVYLKGKDKAIKTIAAIKTFLGFKGLQEKKKVTKAKKKPLRSKKR